MSSGLNRRDFLAGVGGLGAGLGLGGISHWLPLAPPEMGPDWYPGRESFVPSTCMLCPSRCGIRGRVVDGNLLRIVGNPQHPVSQGGLCAKGVAGIQLLYSPARITGPIERTGPPGSAEFSKISWEEATERVGSRLAGLRSAGRAGSLAWLTGDVTGMMREVIDRFNATFGAPQALREGYDDGSPEVMRLSQGVPSPPAFDLSGSDFVLSFGAALSEAWPALPLSAAARKPRRGRRPRWIQADVRLSRTAARADEFLAVRPGTHGILALGVFYVILKEGLFDAERVSDEVIGIEDWTDSQGRTVEGIRTLVLRHGRTDSVSEKTGVPAEQIVRVAKEFSAARNPVALWDHNVSWRHGGLADAMAIHSLNILTGALNRRGGVLVQPPLPVSPLGETLPRSTPREDAGGLTAANWAERVAAGDGGGIDTLFLYYSNPASSSPDRDTVIRALKEIPYVVSFSPFLDETARHADLVLPDHTYLERWQDAPAPPSVPIAVWNVVQPMTSPLHDTMATGDFVLKLASRLGEDVGDALPWASIEELVTARGRTLAEAHRGSPFVTDFRREELREMASRGWWLPHRMSGDEFWDSLREAGGWFDPHYDYDDRSMRSGFPDGRVRIFPAEARDLIQARVPGLTSGFLPVPEGSGKGTSRDADFPLHLNPYHVMTLASGGTPLMPWLLENLGVMTGNAWETWAEINPETGHELGLASGQIVSVESATGAFRARLRFFQGAQPGVLNVPYGLHTTVEGWGRCDGANPLAAVGNRREPVSGLPDWYSTRVRIVSI